MTGEQLAEFVRVWQESRTMDEVIERMASYGITGDNDNMSTRAYNLRQQGIPLKYYSSAPGAKTKKGPSLAVVYENENPEWRTPEWLVECARELLVEIDLDPATDEAANKTVQAEHIFTANSNGLDKRWSLEGGYPSRVFVNPPGRLVIDFWDKLCAEWDANRVLSAFWVGFNIDHLRSLATRPKHPLGFYTCFPMKRIKFDHPQGKVSRTPSCSNFLTWLPDEDCNENWRRFCDVMGKYGRCVRGHEGFYSGEPYVKHHNAGVSCRTRRVRLAEGGLRSSDGAGQGSGT